MAGKRGAVLTAEKVITERQAKALFKEVERDRDAALANGKGLAAVTDYYLFAIAFNTGGRVSELADLVWSDVGEDFVSIRHGKGDRARSITIGPKTLKLFASFKAFQQQRLGRQCGDADPIFVGKRGRLTRSGMHARMKFWLERAKLPDALSMHSWRHGFATRLLDHGVPLQAVKEQLGHSSISTTSVYLHLTQEAKAKLKALL